MRRDWSWGLGEICSLSLRIGSVFAAAAGCNLESEISGLGLGKQSTNRGERPLIRSSLKSGLLAEAEPACRTQNK